MDDELIIEELKYNSTYNSSLMSYLNSNTEIISVNENEDELVINFNSAILGDINTKDILEEVIYTISMSINDNYDKVLMIERISEEVDTSKVGTYRLGYRVVDSSGNITTNWNIYSSFFVVELWYYKIDPLLRKKQATPIRRQNYTK